jgi:hypothetical protein
MTRDTKGRKGGITPSPQTHIVVGEGKSEKIYFDKIRSEFSDLNIHTSDAKGGDIPKIKRAVGREKEYFRKGDTLAIVLDVDRKTPEEIEAFIKWCHEQGVEVYISNPSFEAYLLMHYQNVSGSLTQKDLEDALTLKLGYKYDKGQGIPLDEEKIKDAVSRAQKALPDKQLDTLSSYRRPGTTTVHKLVRKLATKITFR